MWKTCHEKSTACYTQIIFLKVKFIDNEPKSKMINSYHTQYYVEVNYIWIFDRKNDKHKLQRTVDKHIFKFIKNV